MIVKKGEKDLMKIKPLTVIQETFRKKVSKNFCGEKIYRTLVFQIEESSITIIY